MDQPRLYEWYDRAAILALLGDPRNVTSFCDGQWLIAKKVAVCLTKVVKTWPGFDFFVNDLSFSHFGDARTFIWVADKPYEVRNPRKYSKSYLPAQVDWQGPPRNEGKEKGKERVIHLFVHTDDADRYMYVGQLEPSYGGGGKPIIAEPGDQQLLKSPAVHFGDAWFRMKKALPDEARIMLFGPDPGDLDHASLDRALSRLPSATTVEDRLDILRRLVEYWHSPIRLEDGYTEEELAGKKLPDVLRWWYRWAGRRKEIMSGDHELLGPDKLEYHDQGMLVFFKENQHCFELGTHVEGNDTPVFSRDTGSHSWQPENSTLSQHLMLACLSAAVPKRTPYRASSAEDLEDELIGKLEKQVPPLALPPWKWCDNMRFCAKNGAFMILTDPGLVWLGAKTAQAFKPLRRYLNEEDWVY